MSWFRIAAHDLRAGVLRRRYLAALVIFGIPCFSCIIRQGEALGGGLDVLAYCLKGVRPLESGPNDFEFPIFWFLVMGGGLFLNLDYPLNDLTEAGQQVLIRSVSKRGWFLSKCLWCLLSCGVYLLLGTITAFFFGAVFGRGLDVQVSPQFYEQMMGLYVPEVTPGQVLIGAVLLPYLTMAAYHVLQMVFCLFMKPIFSFLICICMLVVSIFVYSPFMLGNGAMVMRSGSLQEGALALDQTALLCVGVIAAAILAGVIRFRRMDFLRWEG